MHYTLLYLPTSDQIFTDGCKVINHKGEVFTWDEDNQWDKKGYRVAEPFLVEHEFNKMVVIGRPSKESLKWLKPGYIVKAVDCFYTPNLNGDYFSILCPTCSHLH